MTSLLKVIPKELIVKEILIKTDPQSIFFFCKISKEAHKICKDKYFWIDYVIKNNLTHVEFDALIRTLVRENEFNVFKILVDNLDEFNHLIDQRTKTFSVLWFLAHENKKAIQYFQLDDILGTLKDQVNYARRILDNIQLLKTNFKEEYFKVVYKFYIKEREQYTDFIFDYVLYNIKKNDHYAVLTLLKGLPTETSRDTWKLHFVSTFVAGCLRFNFIELIEDILDVYNKNEKAIKQINRVIIEHGTRKQIESFFNVSIYDLEFIDIFKTNVGTSWAANLYDHDLYEYAMALDIGFIFIQKLCPTLDPKKHIVLIENEYKDKNDNEKIIIVKRVIRSAEYSGYTYYANVMENYLESINM